MICFGLLRGQHFLAKNAHLLVALKISCKLMKHKTIQSRKKKNLYLHFKIHLQHVSTRREFVIEQVTKYCIQPFHHRVSSLLFCKCPHLERGQGLTSQCGVHRSPIFQLMELGDMLLLLASGVVRKLRRKKRVVQLNPSLCLGSQLSTDPYLKCLQGRKNVKRERGGKSMDKV